MSTIPRRMTTLIAALLAVTSAAGLAIPAVYQRETASWAAQGMGQDVVDLLIVFPALLIAMTRARAGSPWAAALWRGLMLYVIYSFVLYAFFMHFNILFPLYVAVLGLSFFALVTNTIRIDRGRAAHYFVDTFTRRSVSAFLVVISLAFAGLWLNEIVPALIAGTTPWSALHMGFPVNPVHVMDLAIMLPGMVMVAVLLWRNNVWGRVWAAPMLVFMIVMGVAILAMSLVMFRHGVAVASGPLLLIMSLIIVAVALTLHYLDDYRRINLAG